MKVEYHPHGTDKTPASMELAYYIEHRALRVHTGPDHARDQQENIIKFLGALTDILAREGLIRLTDIIFLTKGWHNPPTRLAHPVTIKEVAN